MKKQILSIILLAGFLVLNSVIQLQDNHEKINSTINGKILIKFKSDIIDSEKYVNRLSDIKNEQLISVFKDFNVDEFYAVFKNRYSDNGKLKKSNTGTTNLYELENWREIFLKDNQIATKLIKILNSKKSIELALIERPLLFKAHLIPNDFDFGDQWYFNDITGISAIDAWDINTGRNDVIVAVLDGGIDYNHPDLDPGDRSRIIEVIDTGSDDNDPFDDLPGNIPESYAGHGTSVAGVIGAITDNNSLVSGIMWNCQIMPVKMVGSGSLTITYPFGAYNWDFSTTAFPSDVADAIDYATNNNADIINLSYGFPDMGFLINEVALRVPLLFEAVSNAYNNDVVIVAAMGNEGDEDNPTNYPAAFVHEVIAVGATRVDGNRANFSSTGPHINVSAPGVGILTTERGGGTRSIQGTSLSTPIVSGVAGLIISQARDREFSLTNDDVRHILEITADDVPIPDVGFDEDTGFGRVNALSALQLLDEPNTVLHGESYGGTSTYIRTYSPWIYIGSRWGLAASSYYQVDQYEITKHISFDSQFCTTPELWLREKESISMHFGNPNNGYPYAEITNVDTEGFDVRYAAYFVKKNLLGQTINKWMPSSPSTTKIAYTAIGQIATGNISGPDMVCNTNSTFTLENAPPNSTITWAVNSGGVTPNSGNGATAIFRSTCSSIGDARITFTVSNPCGGTGNNQVSRDFIAGGPDPSDVSLVVMDNLTGQQVDPRFMCPNTLYVLLVENSSSCPTSNYSWTLPNGMTEISSSQNWALINTNSSYGGIMFVHAQTCCTDCGTNVQILTEVLSTGGYSCGGYYYSYSPNPVIDELTVAAISTANEDKKVVDPSIKIDFEIRIYDSNKVMVRSEKSKGNEIVVNTAGLKKGTYFLHIIEREKVIKKEQIIVN